MKDHIEYTSTSISICTSVFLPHCKIMHRMKWNSQGGFRGSRLVVQSPCHLLTGSTHVASFHPDNLRDFSPHTNWWAQSVEMTLSRIYMWLQSICRKKPHHLFDWGTFGSLFLLLTSCLFLHHFDDVILPFNCAVWALMPVKCFKCFCASCKCLGFWKMITLEEIALTRRPLASSVFPRV